MLGLQCISNSCSKHTCQQLYGTLCVMTTLHILEIVGTENLMLTAFALSQAAAQTQAVLPA